MYNAVGHHTACSGRELRHPGGQAFKVGTAVRRHLIFGKCQEHRDLTGTPEPFMQQPRHGQAVSGVVALAGDYQVFRPGRTGPGRRQNRTRSAISSGSAAFIRLAAGDDLPRQSLCRPLHKGKALHRPMLYRIEVGPAYVLSCQYLHKLSDPFRADPIRMTASSREPHIPTPYFAQVMRTLSYL